MKYYCIINAYSPSEFYSGNDFIFSVLRKNCFFKSKCKIINKNKEIVLTFTSTKFFFYSKVKILSCNIDNSFFIKQQKSKIYITLDKDILVIKTKPKLLGKYEASCLINNRIIGKINEEYIFPNSSYNFSFDDNKYNYYFLILFAIISVGFSDTA